MATQTLTTVLSAPELASLLLAKAKAASTGKDMAGAETLCRCTETFIKLARLEMDVASMVPHAPRQLPAAARWVPFDFTGVDTADSSILQAALKAGESHLSGLEDAIETIAAKSPKHVAVKVLSAEATFVRIYLLCLRDELNPE